MPKVEPRRPIVDRSSAVAYLGVGAAIAFIAAMTLGAIETPADHEQRSVTAQSDGPTQFPAAGSRNGEAKIR